MRFADIAGHEEVKQRLRDMVDTGRIPHALLLEGPSGIGKMMMARALAQYIHCQHHINGDSCGQCPQCRQHEAFNNLDTFYSYPVVKRAGRTAVSADYLPDFIPFVQESPLMDMTLWLQRLDNVNAQPAIYVEEGAALTRSMSLTAQVSKYKIVVMWLPERMQEATANKLLKLVEEPFPDTIFIMVSNHPQGILPTIYSRVQRIEMKRFTTSDLVDILVRDYQLTPEEAQEASRLGEGSILGALKVLDDTRQAADNLQYFQQVMRYAFQRDLKNMKKWANDLAGLGREGAVRFIAYAQKMIRENFIYPLALPELQRLNADEAGFSVKFHPYINERNVQDIIRLLDQASADILGNANAKIVFFDTALQLAMLIRK